MAGGHEGKTCFEASDAGRNLQDEEDLKRYYQGPNVMGFRCLGKGGKCKAVVIKLSACNHVKCPACKEFSCWGCGSLWETNDNGKRRYWDSDPNHAEYSVHYKLHHPAKRSYNGDEAFPNYPWKN